MSLKTLRRFSRLDTTQKTVVLASAAALIMTRIGLRVCGLRLWQKLLSTCGAPVGRNVHSIDSLSAAQAIARLQASAERHLFFRPSCLEHSIVLRWILTRAGIPARMIIGGRKQGTQFEAHAWVEVNGTSLESAGAAGTAFARFDAVHSSLETRIS